MTSSTPLRQLAAHLRAASDRLTSCQVVAGFDGFVDEIISVVNSRQNLQEWEKVPAITDFQALIAQAAGHSSLREIVIERLDAGGCAVNLSDGLAELGVTVDCFATMGSPRNPAFDSLAAKAHGCFSWGTQYGRTLAFEFADGKLMYSAVSQLTEFNTNLLENALRDDQYFHSCRKAGVIALTDWTLYPHMTACWELLQNKIYSQLSHRPYFFIDLVDPSSRNDVDILAMLTVLKKFEQYGPTILGLNGNEANILSRILDLRLTGSDLSNVKQQARELRKNLGIDQVVIHHRKFAALANTTDTVAAEGPFCPAPKKSTGAGDRFNAGYCLALLLQLDPLSCLNLAAAVTGLFVRKGHSATLDELITFIERWADGKPDAPLV